MGWGLRKVTLDLKTTGALAIFALVLIAYTTQTELAQYVQHSQGYRKPYFLLWMTHSGYVLILPLHLCALRLLSISIPESLSILRGVFRVQFAAEPSVVPPGTSHPGLGGRSTSRSSIMGRNQSRSRGFHSLGGRGGRKMWKWRLGWMVVRLTLLIAFPALTWYAAVPLTSMTNITAIYNVFAFWAYLLAIKFLGEEPSRWKLVSVLLAVAGVFTIAYGDSIGAKDESPGDVNSRMVGNLLAFVGSVAYAWYEVWYKLHAALPERSATDDDETLEDEVDALLADNAIDNESSIEGTPDSSNISVHGRHPSSALSVATSITLSRDVTHPSSATFLLHSNVITSLIGLTTFGLLWIPIPILHWIGWENFELPPRESALAIVGIILSGVVFNSGFMILLSLWGPVVASVGNLCTLVLVAVADTLLSPQGHSLSRFTLAGSAMVCAAFAMLVVGAFHSGVEG